MEARSRFGKYALIDRIAVGGMAEIFRARQIGVAGFERTVVIKRIRPALCQDPRFVRMFLNEARLAAQLNHPNIVAIHDLGESDGSYFIAMEYVFGRDMRRIVPRSEALGISFPPQYALRIASAVCEGLHYAHTLRDARDRPFDLVHRDVTPENVLVSFDGTVKILDFGVAKVQGGDGTRAGELKGKVGYMSPEQALSRPVDARSDVFSLGVVLYEWLTGYRLFTGEGEIAVLRSIVESPVQPPSVFRVDIRPRLDAILLRALEKDPVRRYQTARDLQYDLDQLLRESDFNPSNLHLANFLQQIFHDELEEERRTLLRARQDETGEDDEGTVPGVARGDVGAQQAGDGDLRVTLKRGERAALERLAARHGLSPEALARQILSGWLKER